MSGDSLVYDMSNMTEGQPSVFVKRDWLNIQDQNNGNYGANQIIIDTSALANSNKYMAYREAYLAIPMVMAVAAPVLSATSVAITFTSTAGGATLTNVTIGPSASQTSITVDQAKALAGSTITPVGAILPSPGPYTVAAASSQTAAGSLVLTSGTNITAGTGTASTFATLSSTSSNYLAGVANKTNSRIVGLKSWFGSIIHSMTLDYAGTTILQQTPWQSMWTMFGLMTTLGLSDLEQNASTIGFWPDAASGFQWRSDASSSGVGSCWNAPGGQWYQQADPDEGMTGAGNAGASQRQINTFTDATALSGTVGAAFSQLMTADRMGELYRSTVFQYNTTPTSTNNAYGIVYQIQAQIFLRHLHSFFSQVPLLKGVFFRLTLNVNQPVVTVQKSASNELSISNITSPLGGVVPLMIMGGSEPLAGLSADGKKVKLSNYTANTISAPPSPVQLQATLNVGNTIINQSQRNYLGDVQTKLNRSCILYVPSYTFNPSFEESYLSRPTKQIVYTDIYQFTTSKVSPSAPFNFLLTNGISNIKSVLILPFFPQITTQDQGGSTSSVTYPVYQSPFDAAGCGPTSPLTSIQNFNVVVAGQNMIYNTQQYNFEQFLNQLVGVNSINANLTDGLTSGLVDFKSFQQGYSYYYVNCSRMLPIDEAVPKSVSIQGTNPSLMDVQYLCFIEYGVQVSVDVLTGARV